MYHFTKNINNLVNAKAIVRPHFRQKATSSADYCLELVRKHDYENFVCTLFLKNKFRSSALAVRSFNIEIARISEQVSQANIGYMRLKFWEETLDKCFTKDASKVPQHPVAIELFKAISREPMSKRYFKTLINSRGDHLNKTSFTTLDEVEKYAEATVSNVYYLIMEGCGVKNIHADHAASHLGKAQGIAQQLRTIPLARKVNFIAIPQDVLIKNKVSQEDILRAKMQENVIESAFEVASRAHQHLEKARNMLAQVPSDARSCLLPAIAVENYLNRLQNVHYNVFHPSLQHRSWLWLPKLWYNNYHNKY